MSNNPDKYICITNGFTVTSESGKKVSVLNGEIVETDEEGYLVKDGVRLCHSEGIVGHYHFQKFKKNKKGCFMDKSKVKELCGRINDLSAPLNYLNHREVQECLCEILKECGYEEESGHGKN